MRVGFVGLGRMGTPMAVNVARSGFDLTVWNRTPSKAAEVAEATDATVAATPRQVAETTDLVLTMLADDDASTRAHMEADGLFEAASGASVFVAMGTVSPSHIDLLAERAGGREVVDAPVSGSVDAARSGQLQIMVGADEAEVASIAPVLSAMGENLEFLGRRGAAAAMKLVVNLLIHGLNQTVSEALTLAEVSGIDPDDAYRVLEGSAAAAPMLGYRKAQYLAEAASPVTFALSLARKDVELALALAESHDLDMPQARLNLEQLRAAENQGLGDRDMAALLAYRRSHL